MTCEEPAAGPHHLLSPKVDAMGCACSSGSSATLPLVMDQDERRSRDEQNWTAYQGFKVAKIYPVEWESAIAELYYGEQIWAYVSLEGVDQAATGAARIEGARVVVEFWREPDKPTAVWDFNLDLAGPWSNSGVPRSGCSRTKRAGRRPPTRASVPQGGL